MKIIQLKYSFTLLPILCLVFGCISADQIFLHAQSITISKGTNLYIINQASEVYTDTVIHLSSNNLAELDLNKKKNKKEFAANKKKKRIRSHERFDSKSSENAERKNKICLIPAGKHAVNSYYARVTGVHQQLFSFKILKPHNELLKYEEYTKYEVLRSDNYSENIKKSNIKIQYRQRPPPIYV